MYLGGLAAPAQEARTFHYSRNQLRVVLDYTTGSPYLSKSSGSKPAALFSIIQVIDTAKATHSASLLVFAVRSPGNNQHPRMQGRNDMALGAGGRHHKINLLTPSTTTYDPAGKIGPTGRLKASDILSFLAFGSICHLFVLVTSSLEVCLHLQRCSGGVFTPPEVLWRCVYTSRGALEVCLHLQRCSGGVFTPPEVLWRCVYTSRGALEVCLHLQRCSGGVFTPPEVLWRCVYTSRGALEVCLHLQRCSGGVFTPPEVLWRCVYTSRGALEVCLHLQSTARQGGTSSASRLTCLPGWYRYQLGEQADLLAGLPSEQVEQLAEQVDLLAELVPARQAGRPACWAATSSASR
ncbi:hypothetical protein PCASD_22644 [Puccinia coronata f. sp. avenae]|uniref:Uncharacterized protein n=1 Tax=Puccinia coronata f. sp. avenae TaxID=200324 RepID=A0A2N5SE48_9BASI|nr:hypothetical protein PCASD_22644 [Puccinia coronata f. sp. avenae]